MGLVASPVSESSSQPPSFLTPCSVNSTLLTVLKKGIRAEKLAGQAPVLSSSTAENLNPPILSVSKGMVYTPYLIGCGQRGPLGRPACIEVNSIQSCYIRSIIYIKGQLLFISEAQLFVGNYGSIHGVNG